jgi:hypothetical protein
MTDIVGPGIGGVLFPYLWSGAVWGLHRSRASQSDRPPAARGLRHGGDHQRDMGLGSFTETKFTQDGRLVDRTYLPA